MVRGRLSRFRGTSRCSIRHHEGGNHVDVPGTLTAFYEILDGKFVEAKPVVSDVLEG
jgi:hypothetical protein